MIWVEFVELWTIENLHIFTLCQINEVERHLTEELLCFGLSKLIGLHLYLVDGQRIIGLHEPSFFFMLLPEGLWMLASVVLRVDAVLLFKLG